MKSSLLWDVMQHRLVVSYWRVRTTYQSHPWGLGRACIRLPPQTCCAFFLM